MHSHMHALMTHACALAYLHVLLTHACVPDCLQAKATALAALTSVPALQAYACAFVHVHVCLDPCMCICRICMCHVVTYAAYACVMW